MTEAQAFTLKLEPQEQPKPSEGANPEPATKTYTWKGKGKKSLTYDATAEMLPVHEDDGTLIGHMFALSYVTDEQDKSDRPVTFCWNGGPGGSSAMVNVGGLGPRRVPIATLDQLPCPTQPEDNPYSLLPSSDLVYIDALGTGYSKVAKGYDPKKVWGVDGDADAFMRGISQWLTTHDRWNSPLYLYGESYGTMRNAVLMRVLGERGIALTGVVEQSTILDYAPTLSGNDLYYMGMLPVYAATANHFGKAGKGVDQFKWFDKAWDFVDEKYGRALIKCDEIDPKEEKAVAKEMSQLIGIPADVIQQKHLRIELDTFRKLLLADEGLFIGRYDTRFTEPAYMDVQGDNEFFAGEDPSGDADNLPRPVGMDEAGPGNRLQGLAAEHAALVQGEHGLELDAPGAWHHGQPVMPQHGIRHGHGASPQPALPRAVLRRHPRRGHAVLERQARHVEDVPSRQHQGPHRVLRPRERAHGLRGPAHA